MCPSRSPKPAGRSGAPGLTLIELILSLAIMAIMAGVLSGLASAVQQGARYSQSSAAAAQHGRVALERIARCISQAYATADHPGAAVVYETIGTHRFPDTLIVWRPQGAPANPQGPPLAGELVIFCPDPAQPNRLVELTVPDDTRAVPLDGTLDTPSGRALVNSIKLSAAARKVTLTELLRTALPWARAPTPANLRGAVRFVCELHPTAAEWQAYKSGTTAWTALPWPQGLYSASTGVRQVWVRTEIQLVGDVTASGLNYEASEVTPYLGSAAIYYGMTP